MREKRRKVKGKEIVTVALVCLLCLSSIAVGKHFIKKDGDNTEKKESEIINLNAETTVDKSEQETKKISNDIAVDGNVVKESTENKNVSDKELSNEKNEVNEETYTIDISNNEEITSENVIDVSGSASNLVFDENEKIKWPVEGDVLIDYSMSNTIYFPTLDTYKCNPAVVIQSEKGTKVVAGVKGIVKKVTTEDEIGNCIIIDIGSGYEVTYGQLSDIKVLEGDEVNADTCIGLVADTTRYYRNEGTNLYFKIEKDGNPCDPMNYLE